MIVKIIVIRLKVDESLKEIKQKIKDNELERHIILLYDRKK